MSTLATLDEKSEEVVSRMTAAFDVTDAPVTFHIHSQTIHAEDVPVTFCIPGSTFDVTAEGMTYSDAYSGDHQIADLIRIAAARSEREVEDHGDGIHVAAKV